MRRSVRTPTLVLGAFALAAAAAYPTMSAQAAAAPTSPAGTNFLTSPTANAQAQLAADNVGSESSPDASWAANHANPNQRQTLANALGAPAVVAHDDGQAALVGPRLAGMAVVKDGLEVQLAGTPDPAVAAAASQLAGPTVPVHVKWVANSQATLDALTQQVAGDRAYWAQQGLTLSEWGPDYTSNEVSVTFTTTPSEAQSKLISARYAGKVLPQKHAEALAQRSSRTNDTSPFYGGDQTTDHTTKEGCTSGFTLWKKGVSHISTAGHCAGKTGSGSLNHTYYNGNHVDAAHSMGTVVARSFINGGDLDYEVLSGHGSQSIWGGSAIQTAWVRTVTSVASTDLKNGLICTSGAYTKEVCGVKIHSPSICKTFTDGNATCGLVSASKSYVTVSVDGDSGGIVDTTLGHDSAEARGMIIGGEDLDQIVYYTPIRFITRAYGASILY